MFALSCCLQVHRKPVLWLLVAVRSVLFQLRLQGMSRYIITLTSKPKRRQLTLTTVVALSKPPV